MEKVSMAIRGVIFDLGHTLMYLDSTWPEVFEHGVADLAAFLQDQGLGLDGAAFARMLLARREEGFAQAGRTRREVTAEDSMRWVLAQFGLFDPEPALVAGAIDAFFTYEQAHWLAFPEAQAVLQELSGRGLRLGMLSNATHDPLIQRLVDCLGFRPWLDPALSSARTGIRKPDPAAFAPILEAWRLPAASVAVVGDTLDADILGARQAGMRSIWLPSREDARQEGTQGTAVPDATVRRLSEVPDCLERLQADMAE
jgi:putative hydrolase of the HAD superfamily